MVKPRPLDDLGPDFEHRWKQAALARRREFIAELLDLYVMLEHRDAALLAKLSRGSIPALSDQELPLLTPEPAHQHTLFDEPAAMPPRPNKENPFLPRSVLDRLQQSRDRANAGLRDLLQTTADDLQSPKMTTAPADLTDLPPSECSEVSTQTPVAALDPLPAPIGPAAQARLDEMERDLRLKLGPVVESLIESQMEQLKSELRVRLRFEMERIIATHLRK